MRSLLVFLTVFTAMWLVSCSVEKSEAEHIVAAKARLGAGDVNAAVIELRQALAQSPESADLRILLARALRESGDAAAAQIEAQKGLGLSGESDEAKAEMARVLLVAGLSQQLIGQYGGIQLRDRLNNASLRTSVAAAQASVGQLDQAADTVAAVVNAVPDFPEAVVLASRIEAAQGKVAQAIARLDNLLKSSPGQAEAAILRADLEMSSTRNAEVALRILARAQEANPRAAEILGTQVGLFLDLDRPLDATKLVGQMDKLAPGSSGALKARAQVDFAAGRYSQVRDLAAAIVKRGGADAAVLTLAGAAELKLGQPATALEYLAKAVASAAEYRPARMVLAQAQLQAGQPAKALEVLEPLLKLAPPDGAAWMLAGEGYARLRNMPRAQAAFARAEESKSSGAEVKVARAMALARTGDLGTATKLLEKSLAESGSGRSALALVMLKVGAGDMRGALRASDEAERLQPQESLPLFVRAQVLSQMGDRAGAMDALGKALQKDPRSFEATQMTAAIDFDSGRRKEAHERLRVFAQEQRGQPRAWIALAEAERRMGAPEQAVAGTLRKGLASNAGDPDLHLALCQLFVDASMAREALEAARNAVAAVPGDQRLRMMLGKAQQISGDTESALTTFRQLSALAPDNVHYLLLGAEVALKRGLLPEAEKLLRKALSNEPENVDAQRGLALVLMASDHESDAMAIAKKLQTRHPKAPVGFLLEADLQAKKGDKFAVVRATSEALKRAPLAELAIRRHQASVAAGDAAEAEKFAQSWLKSHPKDQAFLFHLGSTVLRQGDWSRAEELFSQVLSLDPAHGAALNNVAWLMAKLKRKGAVEMAERALAALPDRAAVLDTLALAQESVGVPEKAADALRRAVALEPNNPLLTLRLARVLVAAGDKSAALKLTDQLLGQQLAPDLKAEVQLLAQSLNK